MTDEPREQAAEHLRRAAALIEEGEKGHAIEQIDSALGLWPNIVSEDRKRVLRRIGLPEDEP